MADKAFTLPEHDDLLARLKQINDDPHACEKFYPHLLRHAGKQKEPTGIVVLLQLAIHDYTAGMPTAMIAVMNVSMPKYIEALCPDEEAATEAKAFWQEALDAD